MWTSFWGAGHWRSIRDLNEGNIEDFLNDLPATLAPKTVANIKGTLHKILTDAYRRRDIARIPDFPDVEVGEPETKWITPEEQERILAEVKCPVRRAYYVFLMHMGCRPGEARALRWDRVNPKDELVTISAAMDMEQYRPYTKEKDVRVLPMPSEVVRALKSLPRSLSGFVFDIKGKPVQEKAVRRTWQKAAKAAGVEITFYQGTKHSLGGQAVNAGVPLNIIQAYMGHKSPESTRRYAKLKVESLKMIHRENWPSADRQQKAE